MMKGRYPVEEYYYPTDGGLSVPKNKDLELNNDDELSGNMPPDEEALVGVVIGDKQKVNESGLGENKDQDGAADVGVSKSKPRKYFERSKMIESLREDFLRKIEFITGLWRKIDSKEIAGLSAEEFRKKIKDLSQGLSAFVEQPHQVQAEIINLKQGIYSLRSAIQTEKENQKRLGGFYKNKPVLILLQEKLRVLYKKLNNGLEDENYEFVFYVTSFLDNLYNKKRTTEELKSRNDQIGDRAEGLLFVNRMRNLFCERSLRKTNPNRIIDDNFLRKFTGILQEKVMRGENIFKTIEFGNFDIAFHLNKKDFVKRFSEDEFEDLRSSRGFFVIGTPFIFTIIDDGDDADIDMVIKHERGHNLISATENDEIHTARYAKIFIVGLNDKKKKYIESARVDDVDEIEIKSREYVLSVVDNLSAEISADYDNIINGYPSAFINHFYVFMDKVNENIKSQEDILAEDASKDAVAEKKFLKIVREELERVVAKARSLVLEIVVYSHLARKHHLEDEFKSTLIMMPTSTKYLRRFFELKLGKDAINFDLAKQEINPDEVFAGASDWLKKEARNLFPYNR